MGDGRRVTVAFWFMLGATAVCLLSLALAVGLPDSIGELFIRVLYLARAVAVVAGVVFVLLFGLDALGIEININHT
jgi:hypothetical protein